MPNETEPQVALVNMPFGYLLAPSVGLSLLKAGLARRRVAARVLYFHLRFAKMMGERAYARVYDETDTAQLAGEWVFAESLFPGRPEGAAERYLDEVLRCRAADPAGRRAYEYRVAEEVVAAVAAARAHVEPFLEECLEEVAALRPRVVGFTSMFHQHVASLSLARRIKARLPDAFVVFGGPNCEGVMGRETLERFEFVDAVVSGEGDLVFPELVGRVLDGRPFDDIAGVHARGRRRRVLHAPAATNAPVVEALDELPYPDYDDYFAQLAELQVDLPGKPALLFETSRGCWWGEKHHCTFCGLNGATMTYRSKSAARALAELDHLTARHPGCRVNAVDNILDMAYFKDFIPLLGGRGGGLNLFYEVKSNLKKEHLRLLRAAGVRAVQPGIESLSDDVLRIMRKGVTGLQNVQLLKWCREVGVRPYWNFIWGFPGESPDDYAEMARLVPLITHLAPPLGVSTIRIDRFSPNFDQAEQLGFRGLAPYPAYGHVYPFAPDALARLAYFFTFDYAEPRDVASYVRPLAREIRRWRKCHRGSELFWMEKGERLLVWDFRPAGRERLTVLAGARKFAYQECDRVRTARQVGAAWRRASGAARAEAEAGEALADLTARGLMLNSGESYLALAVPRPPAKAAPRA